VRVAMIPVGYQRMREDYEAHAILRMPASESYSSA
jgi:hypothetical protein